MRSVNPIPAARVFAAALAFAGFAAELSAHAEEDAWTGGDKRAHFAASAVIAAGGYQLGTHAFDARWHALAFGGAAAVLAGTGKELADLAGAGTASWRDFAWDLLGTAAGLGLAWVVDLTVRGVRGSQPALGSPHGIRF
jgi:putative lipoprotein